MTSPLNKFGRVDADNNVFVIDEGTERKVGQYPDATPEVALAYYERKFSDLESQVRILEQRVANKVDTHGLKKTVSKLIEDLAEPSAVGDLADLRRRANNLLPKVEALIAEKSSVTKEAVAESIQKREAIAAEAEKIANQDSAKIQWKASSAKMTELFTQWQALQKQGPKVPKSESDAIWRRFSVARTKFEAGKRQFFASLDATNKASKAKKAEIVAKAEALAASGGAVADYRALLDAWKTSGRSDSKTDDALWVRFKAAGDAIYAAKAEQIAVENVEYQANLAAKLEILKDAAKIDPAKDLAEAKRQLLAIQTRWEAAGKVPRDKMRETEDKLRAVEAKVRKAEEDHWKATDPAAQARSNSVVEQLETAIAKLENQLAAAKAAKDKKATDEATEALKARKAWLEVVKASSK